jgi:hypothetical protein
MRWMHDADVKASIDRGRGAVEAVYREQGDRLWRAIRLATGNSEIANDAGIEREGPRCLGVAIRVSDRRRGASAT